MNSVWHVLNVRFMLLVVDLNGVRMEVRRVLIGVGLCVRLKLMVLFVGIVVRCGYSVGGRLWIGLVFIRMRLMRLLVRLVLNVSNGAPVYVGWVNYYVLYDYAG